MFPFYAPVQVSWSEEAQNHLDSKWVVCLLIVKIYIHKNDKFWSNIVICKSPNANWSVRLTLW